MYVIMLKALRTAAETGPKQEGCATGLCAQVHDAVMRMDLPYQKRLAVLDECNALMGRWPEHSGNSFYPVPTPTGEHPELAYNRGTVHEMWSREHPYGAARWRLIDWMIDQCEQRIASGKEAAKRLPPGGMPKRDIGPFGGLLNYCN